MIQRKVPVLWPEIVLASAERVRPGGAAASRVECESLTPGVGDSSRRKEAALRRGLFEVRDQQLEEEPRHGLVAFIRDHVQRGVPLIVLRPHLGATLDEEPRRGLMAYTVSQGARSPAEFLFVTSIISLIFLNLP